MLGLHLQNYMHMVDILFGSHLPTYEHAIVHIELLDK